MSCEQCRRSGARTNDDGSRFVGLGAMGLPMARNLLRAGFTVRGFDLSPAALDRA